MALVTVSRSPPASGHSTPVGPTQDRVVRRRGRLQRRQPSWRQPDPPDFATCW
uniref:Slingshot protein phosphatase 3 n=1 Tax=Mus musculus TaxID=10090 RepID=A0A494BAH4_MOUSE